MTINRPLNLLQQKAHRAVIRMESSLRGIPNHLPNQIAEEMCSTGCRVNATFSLKKKKEKKLSLTLISGPHVHKKSRDQYQIQKFTGWFSVILKNRLESKVFLEILNAKKKKHPEIEFSISHLEQETLIL